MARKYVWMDGECRNCYGMGLVLPTIEPLAEDCELELCPKCSGHGRTPKRLEAQGFINGLVASMLLKEGSAWITRKQARIEIEKIYG